MTDPGYRLPVGECYTEELCPIVVCVPRKDEYFQAFWGMLSYMGTWTAWERDSAKRGKDAAAAWRFANDETGIGERMGCLDDLVQDVADILLYLQSKKDCCDDTLTYGPSTEVETEIEPLVGDPPEFYGETAVTDWDDWLEHVCYNAHLWVDELVRQAETIETALAVGGVAIGLVAGTLAVIGFLATGGALSVPILMAISAALASGGASSMFAQAATDIEDARGAIVCDLILGRDVAATIEAELTIASSWTLFFQHADYDSATAVIYEGGQGTNYLPSETRDDCTGCEHPYNFDITYTFAASGENWTASNYAWSATRYLRQSQVSSGHGHLYLSKNQLLSDIGHSGATKIEINYLEALYENYQVSSPPTGIHNGLDRPDTSWLSFGHSIAGNGVPITHTDTFPDEELGSRIHFRATSQAGGGNQWVFCDNIRIRGWVTD